MTCGYDPVAVQIDFVAAHFIRPVSIAIRDDQNTAACRHTVKVELIGLSARFIGHACQELMHVHTVGVTRELLPWLLSLFLSRNVSVDEDTK